MMPATLATATEQIDDPNEAMTRWVNRWRVCIISDSPRVSDDIREALSGDLNAEFMTFGRIHRADWSQCDGIIIDAWQKTANDAGEITAVLATLSHLRKPLFLVIGPSMRILLARLGLLDAVTTFARPIVSEVLADSVLKLLSVRVDGARGRETTRNIFSAVPEHADALLAADEALDLIFSLGIRPDGFDRRVIDQQSDTIIGSLAESGIGSWIPGVRLHHDSTYQHCLLVTGVAIAFGQQLRFSRNDLRRIAIGALMHDVGKAKIPVTILDKPSALSETEKAIMSTHPKLGLQMIERQKGISDELKAIVLSHHEYLDGSGYPHGLTAPDLPDIVRLVTVADVFGALIERRSYRQPLSGAEAYDILLSMEGKLDMAIVKAVRETAFTAPS